MKKRGRKTQRSLQIGTALLSISAVLPLGPVRAQETQPVGPYKDFKGTIKLDVRDSKADWEPLTPKKAPVGAPNILFILYDDTGLSAWSPYGGRIARWDIERPWRQLRTQKAGSKTNSELDQRTG